MNNSNFSKTYKSPYYIRENSYNANFTYNKKILSGSALGPYVKKMDPIVKNSITVPIGTEFLLNYDQMEQYNSGMSVIFSASPLNAGANKRRQTVNPVWGTPYIFGPTVLPRHLKNFHASCVSGKSTVMMMGDSIFNAGANLSGPEGNPWEEILTAIKKANPNVELTDYNLTLAGKTWQDMANDMFTDLPGWFGVDINGKSWLQYALSLKPNLVIINCGGNDQWNFDSASMIKIIKEFQNINCDIILCETYQPNTGSPLYYTEENQDSIHFVRRAVVTYAQWIDLGYLPIGRWADMCRDGFDPELLSYAQVEPAEGTAFPAYYTTVPETALFAGKDYFFPKLRNMNGVFADNCTDWCIAIAHSGIAKDTAFWRITLSKATHLNIPNELWLFFTDPSGNITINHSFGCLSDQGTKNTNIPVPRENFYIVISCRGGRVTVSMRTFYHTSYNVEQTTGLGYVKIWDQIIPRYGAPYQPAIQNISASGETFSIAALGVADATRADGGGMRYRPSTSCEAMYYNTAHADTGYGLNCFNIGGSGDYHMNQNGVRDIIYPVIHAQDWSAPSIQRPVATISDITTAPTEADFNNLLAVLRSAGILTPK